MIEATVPELYVDFIQAHVAYLLNTFPFNFISILTQRNSSKHPADPQPSMGEGSESKGGPQRRDLDTAGDVTIGVLRAWDHYRRVLTHTHILICLDTDI